MPGLTGLHHHPCTRSDGESCISAGAEVPFCKPKISEPTRHLYCCNCPTLADGADWQKHVLVEFCRGYGHVESFFSVAGKSWAVVSFVDASAAAAALEALKTTPIEGRKVHVQYADKVEKKKPSVASIPCTSETAHIEIAGLVLAEDFLSRQEEERIVSQIDSLEWESQMSRRVQHYGFRFDYVTRKCSTAAITPFPDLLAMVAARAVSQGLVSRAPDQCTVNEYLPGQGIRYTNIMMMVIIRVGEHDSPAPVSWCMCELGKPGDIVSTSE